MTTALAPHDGAATGVEAAQTPPPPPVDTGGSSGAERALLVAIALAIGLAVFLPRWGQFVPDTRPDLYFTPGRMLVDALSAWTPGATGLGQANFDVGVAPMAAVLWVVRSIGAPAWLAVRIWRWALLVVALFGFRRYATTMFRGRLGGAGRIITAAFAVANPYVLVAGSTTPVLLPYALLPWMLVALERALDEPRRWRYPALAALAFFAMTGMNAGIVPLLTLVAVPCHLAARRIADRAPWSDLARVALRTGLLGAGVSCYWALPVLLAHGSGAGIASATEHPADIAQTTSWAESGRLLGLWPLYGRDSSGLFQGVFVSYLTAPAVVVCSYALPVLAALSAAVARLRRVRVLVGLLVLVSLPVMVGMYPPSHPSLWGRAIRTVFDRFPAAVAFRTTNKIGAVLVLAFALALAGGADRVAHWVRHRPRHRSGAPRWALAVALVALLGGAAGPLWSGSLYEFHWRVPGYWRAAGDAMSALGPGSRTLLLPGETGGHYTWGVDSPDDIVSFLTPHPVAVRSTVGASGDPTANLLTNVDSLLQRDSLPPGSLSTLARYLGAGTALLRNDVAGARFAGAAPGVIAAQTDADPGLQISRLFGRAGVDSSTPGPHATGTAAQLALYDVPHPGALVTGRPASTTVLVDGDGAALPTLADLELLDGSQPFRYLSDMSEAQLLQAVRDGARIELTDSNRRRDYTLNRLAQPFSPTLGATEPIDEGDAPSLTLDPDDPDTQTVAVLAGASAITASPDTFGLKPYGRPDLAFDHNYLTGWITGEFGTGTGKWIDVTFDEPQRLDRVTLVPLVLGSATVTRVRVQAGARSVEAQVSPADPTTVTFPAVTAPSVKVTILSTSGGGNPVGFTEVAVPNVAPVLSARLPRRFSDLVSQLPPDARAAVARLPLDVVFTRLRDAGSPLQSEEPTIARIFELPQQRTVSFSGYVDDPTTLPPEALDELDQIRRGRQDPGQCFAVAQLDGADVHARLAATQASLASGEPVALFPCDDATTLQTGTHRFSAAPGWELDTVRLASFGEPNTAPVSPPSAKPEITVTHRAATSLTARVAGASAPYWLTIGQSWDPRWDATLDGHDLGTPQVIDGYDTGWRVDATGPHVLRVTFAPQRTLNRALALSAVVLAVVVTLALWPAGKQPEPVVAGEEAAVTDTAGGDRRRGRGRRRRRPGAEE